AERNLRIQLKVLWNVRLGKIALGSTVFDWQCCVFPGDFDVHLGNDDSRGNILAQRCPGSPVTSEVR
ncbi:MAG: hypothetical protein VX304_17215, partial [Planctomycetota bacterium]|nr:hypothetical protein [Planctomycetota bacterium]